MNTVQLECFVSVAEHLNFSRASESLDVSQPAVSHQIQTLENELGVKLFKRTSKIVELTEEGMLFLADARYILKTTFEAKERLSKHTHLTSFDIGCHSSLELNLLPDALRQLKQKFPNVRPSIHFFPPLASSNMIDNKKIHATFGFLEDEKVLQSLRFKELVKAPIVCICSSAHPLAKWKTLKKEQLTGSFIACSPQQIPSQLFACQSEILSRTPANQQYFAPNIESALTLIKAQIGYTICYDVASLRDSQLCYIPVQDINETISFGIFFHRDNDHPILQSFLKYCFELFHTS